MWCQTFFAVLLAATLVQSNEMKNEAEQLARYEKTENLTGLIDFYKNVTVEAIHVHEKILMDMKEQLVQKADEIVEGQINKIMEQVDAFNVVLKALEECANPRQVALCVYRGKTNIFNLGDMAREGLVRSKENLVETGESMINGKREQIPQFLDAIDQISQAYSKCESLPAESRPYCENEAITDMKQKSDSICESLLVSQVDTKKEIEVVYHHIELSGKAELQTTVSDGIGFVELTDKCIKSIPQYNN